MSEEDKHKLSKILYYSDIHPADTEFINNIIYDLQQENKQLKEEIEEYKRIEQKDLEAFINYVSILTELEEWLNKIIEITVNLDEKGTCKNVLDKIQELKEKYK